MWKMLVMCHWLLRQWYQDPEYGDGQVYSHEDFKYSVDDLSSYSQVILKLLI